MAQKISSVYQYINLYQSIYLLIFLLIYLFISHLNASPYYHPSINCLFLLNASPPAVFSLPYLTRALVKVPYWPCHPSIEPRFVITLTERLSNLSIRALLSPAISLFLFLSPYLSMALRQPLSTNLATNPG